MIILCMIKAFKNI